MTNRFLRYFNFIAFPELEDVSIKTIYQLVLKTFVEAYLPEGVLAAVHPMVDATIDLYNELRKEMLPTPAKPHYTFNLRDIASVMQGVLSANRA